MAKARLPQSKAEVSGAGIKNPDRFKDRKAPKGGGSIGQPYAAMTENQKVYWEEFKQDLPWLDSSDRVLLRLACIWSARMDEAEDDARFGVSATQALSSILSKLGATPADKTKVSYDPGESDDPSDEFFGKGKVSH